MSGGHFDYQQYRLEDIAYSIEEYVYGREYYPEDIEYVLSQLDTEWDKEEYDYIKEHKHGMPNRYGYSEETIAEFKKGIELLRKAYVYAQRIDWLLSGDDGEETFHERLKEDLEELKEE